MTDIEMRIAVLRAKAGDTIIFQFPHGLTAQQREHVRSYVAPLIPDGVKALVIDPDIVVTLAAAPESHPAETKGFDRWMLERTEREHREHMERTSRLPPSAKRTYSAAEIEKFYGLSHGGID